MDLPPMCMYCKRRNMVSSLSLLFIASYTIAINLFNYQLQMDLF